MSITRLRSWLVGSALPFWAEKGFNRALGLFHERCDLAGEPVAAQPIRAMVQGRQIYVYAHAHLLGWRPDAAGLAATAADNLLGRYMTPAGAVFSIDGAGRVVDGRIDTYSQAFVLFGLAWAYRLSPEPRYLEAARRILRILDGRLAAPAFGGQIDGDPRPDSLRRQNPHMHLFEACIAWHEATGDAGFLARAGEVFSLFATRFFHPATGILGEYFDDAWMPAPGAKGRISEPGHHFEWVWLLRRYAALADRDVQRYTSALFDHARRWGVDGNGLVRAEVLDTGEPLNGSRRTWPLTEAIKAAAAEHEAGREGMARFADGTSAAMMDVFLGRPFPGGWIDHIDAEGTPLVDFAPASTLYHVMLAAAEASRVFEADSGAGPASQPEKAA